MAWIDSVYDRTNLDLTNLKSIINKVKAGGYKSLSASDKAYWLADLVKGALNFTDLNRIENNMKELQEFLITLGYDVDIETKTDWTRNDLIYQDDITRLMNNYTELSNKALLYNKDIKFILTSNPSYWSDIPSYYTWEDLGEDSDWYKVIHDILINKMITNFLLDIHHVNGLEEALEIIKTGIGVI